MTELKHELFTYDSMRWRQELSVKNKDGYLYDFGEMQVCEAMEGFGNAKHKFN